MSLIIREHDEVQTLEQELRSRGVRYAVAGFTDVHGRIKGKVVPIDHLAQMAAGSELFTGAALDGLPQDVAEEELSARPDLTRGCQLPWNPEFAYFPSSMYCQGEPFEAASRNVLVRQLDRAAEHGLTFNLGIETEFFVLDPNGDNVSDRDRLDKPCYDVPTLFDNAPWLIELVGAMDELGWDVYSFDHEDAQGQFEIDFMYADALTMADRVTFFRMMAGEIARKHGHLASFMPKPFADRSGSGAHVNMSLSGLDGQQNLFLGDDRGGLSTLAGHFIAGILDHAEAICAVIAPTVNSYKRLRRSGSMSGSTWAPVFVSYGTNNRTNMLRIPLAQDRVECRAADISCNPYLGGAMLLAAGMDGIERELDPGEPHTENLYRATPAEIARQGLRLLPQDLGQAVDAFEADPLSRRVFGPLLHDSWVELKREEWTSYAHHVSQWEIDRYRSFF